ncbi:trichothecene efflux pump [Lophium mytilinum]|uniref:Trichothecene efflux pump n=1 Tax=Lophium mytilinum TaxID=390894 RepID=A0A6A6RDH1_9PEZI|nr:trichothecene efflux pump [Lophium mytilinum]
METSQKPHPDTIRIDEELEEKVGEKTQHVENVDSSTMHSSDNGYDTRMTFRRFMAIMSIGICFFSCIWSIFAISNLITIINEDLGPSESYTWMATAQVLAGGIPTVVLGRLSDIYGRRLFILIGAVLGILGAAICANATSVPMFIGGSAILGVTYSFYQLSWAAIGELVEKRHRPVVFGLMEASAGLSGTFGPVIANLLATRATWRLDLWISFILNVICLVLVFFFYRPIHHRLDDPDKTFWHHLKEIDHGGIFLLVGGLILFLVGISFGGIQYPWKSATVISMLVVGGVLLIMFGFYEAYARIPYPILPSALFTNGRNYMMITAATTIYGMAYLSTIVLLPQEVGYLFTKNPVTIGWYSSAAGIGGFLFSPIAGWILQKTGHAKWFLTACLCGIVLGSGIGALVSTDSYVATVAGAVIVSASSAATGMVTTTMVQVILPPSYIGIATTFLSTCRSVGGAIATTVYTTILTNYIKEHEGTNIAEAAVKAGLNIQYVPALAGALAAQNQTALALVPGVTPLIIEVSVAAILHTLVKAFRLVFYTSLAFGSFGILCALCTKSVDQYMTKDIDVAVERKGPLAHESRHEAGLEA